VPDLLYPASQELLATAKWYEERRAGYGDRLLDEAPELLGLLHRMPITKNPKMLNGVSDGVRQVVLKRFPISIVYVAEPRTGGPTRK
jgi:hypothetical protein